MIKVNKKINLAQLDQEFNGEGLNGVLDDLGNYVEIGLASNNQGNENELKVILANHTAIDVDAQKNAAKTALLEKLGITADEAALLLS